MFRQMKRTERDRQRQGNRQRKREMDRQRKREGGDRQTDRQTDTERDPCCSVPDELKLSVGSKTYTGLSHPLLCKTNRFCRLLGWRCL